MNGHKKGINLPILTISPMSKVQIYIHIFVVHVFMYMNILLSSYGRLHDDKYQYDMMDIKIL